MGKLGTKHGVRNIYPIKGGCRWVYKWEIIDHTGKTRFPSRSFSSKEEAADFKKEKDAELAEQGTSHSLSPEDAKDALHAMRILAGHNDISLSAAATFYLKHNPLNQGVTVEVAVGDYLLYRKPKVLCSEEDLKIRPIRAFQRFAPKTYTDRVGISLKQFKKAFCGRSVSSVMTQEIVDFLMAMEIAAETYNNKMSDIKVFLDWCVQVKKCCEHNSAESIDALAGEFSSPEIFTVDEIRKIIEVSVAHDPQFIPYLVLATFAGIRICEIQRMKVSDIDFDAKLINIRPLVGKSKGSGGVMPRIIEDLPEAVWKWLAAAGGAALVIDTKNLQKRRIRIFEKAGIKFKANGFRHSFATYGYAYHQSDAIVRKQTGHRIPDTFFKHYATTVRKSEGKAYFSILPSVERLPKQGSYKPRYTSKIDWPDVSQIVADVQEIGYKATARKYTEGGGIYVSDVSVRKRLKKFDAVVRRQKPKCSGELTGTN